MSFERLSALLDLPIATTQPASITRSRKKASGRPKKISGYDGPVSLFPSSTASSWLSNVREVARLRKLGLSQQEIAQKSGFSRAMIGRFDSTARWPKEAFELIEKNSDTLTPLDLFKLTDGIWLEVGRRRVDTKKPKLSLMTAIERLTEGKNIHFRREKVEVKNDRLLFRLSEEMERNRKLKEEKKELEKCLSIDQLATVIAERNRLKEMLAATQAKLSSIGQAGVQFSQLSPDEMYLAETIQSRIRCKLSVMNRYILIDAFNQDLRRDVLEKLAISKTPF